MKSLVALFFAGFATVAWACTTHTYFVNGKVVTCTTCCIGNNCTTNCY